VNLAAVTREHHDLAAKVIEQDVVVIHLVVGKLQQTEKFSMESYVARSFDLAAHDRIDLDLSKQLLRFGVVGDQRPQRIFSEEPFQGTLSTSALPQAVQMIARLPRRCAYCPCVLRPHQSHGFSFS
jgi:hypothetical protein